MTLDTARENINSHEPLEPLLAVLHEIEKRGSLLRLMPDRRQRVGLMMALAKQKLVVWDAAAVKYELTDLGSRTLAKFKHGDASEPVSGWQAKTA